MFKDPQREFNRGMQYLTIFGLVLGVIEAAIFYLVTFLFPVWFAWILILIFDGILTGGFHLDAVADTADGMFSSRSADKIHAIMKDSRLGTMGALALIFYYISMIGCAVIISQHFGVLTNVLLVAITIMNTKTGISLVFFNIKNADAENGLLKSWGHISKGKMLFDIGVFLIVTGAALGLKGLIAAILSFLFVPVYKNWIYKRIGGFTGDTVGAFADIYQVIFLLSFLVVIRLWILF